MGEAVDCKAFECNICIEQAKVRKIEKFWLILHQVKNHALKFDQMWDAGPCSDCVRPSLLLAMSVQVSCDDLSSSIIPSLWSFPVQFAAIPHIFLK